MILPSECFRPPGPTIAQLLQKSIAAKKTPLISFIGKFGGFLSLERPCVKKRIWSIRRSKVGQRDLFSVKLKLDVSYHQPDAYARFQVQISKNVEKRPEKLPVAGSSAETPLPSVYGHHMGTICPTMTKISNGRDTCCINVCAQSEGSL